MKEFEITLSEIHQGEEQSYSNIFNCVGKLFGDYVGVYFKLVVDGVDYILQRRDNVFVLYHVSEQGEVNYDMFTVDEEYNVNYAILDDFQVRDEDGNKMIVRHNSSIIEYLSLVHREERDVDGYDGFVQYVQFDQEKDVKLMLIYQQRYNERGEVYGYHVNKLPFQITIQKGLVARQNGSIVPVRTTRYIRGNINESEHPYLYNMAVIKEYGLVEFIEKGPYAVQKDDQMVRYYKVLGQTKEGVAVTAFPFGTQYKFEDFSPMFEKYGFANKIPCDLIKLRNGENDELRKYEAIAAYMKEIEVTPPDDVIQLHLKFEGTGNNDANS